MNFLVKLFWNRNEKRARALWRILFQLAIFIIIAGLSSIPLVFINLFQKNGPDGDSAIFNLTASASLLVATVISLWICGRWIDHRSLSGYGFHFSRQWTADFSFGLCLGAFLMALIFMVEYLTGWVTISAFFTQAAVNEPFLLGLVETIILFLMVGVYEESFFRGYLLRNIAEGVNWKPISPAAAVLIAWFLSSCLFGLIHGGNPNSSWISTLNLVSAGLFLALGFILTGDLAISIGIHITWNFFQGNVFGFPVSGTKPIISFIGISQKGSDWITGGAFGPEAGLIGLAAILLGSLLILAWVFTTRRKITVETSLAVYKTNP